jgi:L-alanine-DL-glutamate epimerase-like enolase superfamily enzyme
MRRRTPNPLFNQADTVVTIETDAGITGIGEGGFPDTLKQCAGRLIGQDPQHIERLVAGYVALVLSTRRAARRRMRWARSTWRCGIFAARR